jgi:hypothetical protein
LRGVSDGKRRLDRMRLAFYYAWTGNQEQGLAASNRDPSDLNRLHADYPTTEAVSCWCAASLRMWLA